jgi:uncharacterized secreted repeat protein (TIGR03808 family)
METMAPRLAATPRRDGMFPATWTAMSKNVPIIHRRGFLRATAGFAVAGLALPAFAAPRLAGIESAAIRGSLDAKELGARPGAPDDQSGTFAKMLADGSRRDAQIFLPPGTYVVSNLTLPARVRLLGVPGATRIVYGGNGYFLLAEDTERLELSGITLDGSAHRMSDQTKGLVDIRGVGKLTIDNCEIVGSTRCGLALERASGRVTNSDISGAADAGLYSVEGKSLAITENRIADCGNGGILVHRWQAAEDGTTISGNRVERILAKGGGTGQNGNGINIFRAANVMVQGNSVADCAFSAIRANSASNIQIVSNNCRHSGETAIYSEFEFEGAVINGNIVDGGANGISIVNFDKGGRMAVCSGNLVRNLVTHGPYPADPPGFGTGIAVEADTAVTGNVIEGAPLYGIQIGWGPYMRNVTATGNIIREAGTGIAVSVVEGTGSAIITGNAVDNAVHGGIVGFRWAAPATGDLAAGAGNDFRNLTVERNQSS